MKITERFEGLMKTHRGYTFFGDLISDEDIEIILYPCLYVKGKIKSAKSIVSEYRLMASGDILAGREIECGGDLVSDGNIEADNIKAGLIKASGSVRATCDIVSADGIFADTIEAGYRIEAMGNIEANNVNAICVDVVWGEIIKKREKNMKKVKWKVEYGLEIPFCPYCDEPIYEKGECVFCGEKHEWVEGKQKDTVLTVGEYTVVQTGNNHISISKDGRMVMHINCTEKCTEEELKNMVSFCEAMKEMP